MDMTSARLLVENLLDRIELNSETGKFRLGTISSKEKFALETLLAATSGTAPNVEQSLIPDTVSIEPTPPLEAVDPGPKPDTSTLPELQHAEASVTLDLRALERTLAENPEVTVCLDFGTAMSKAFAIQGYSTPIELALGKRAGSSGYPVESSLFISDDGILHFGPQAVELGTAAAALGRARFDSPKARLSMGEQVDIHRAAIGKEFNPTDIPMTEGEMITLYLGYLTDLATSELEAQGYSRYCSRRFARPCWPEDRNRWAEPLLRRMLAQAQVLADTFHDQWREGIPLAKVKQAMEKLCELAVLPDYLLGDGIPEPVAAAASLMLTDEAQREMFLVIDVGAGTTDFGLFLLQHNPAKDICLVRIIPGTIMYLPQAGNRVDDLLKFFVLELEGIDVGSPEGEHNRTFLQSTIRLHKEALFRDGIVEVPLANSSRVVVERDTFLASSRLKAFGQLLQDNVAAVLNTVGDGFLDLMHDSHLNVVITGGGADLPMVQSLARDVIEVRGRRVMRRPTLHVPVWITEQYPQFASQYSQLAVAIGGANPELPSIGESLADFKGLRSPTYTA
jgi:hypothetical protein